MATATLVVTDLDANLRDRLQVLADRNGRSLDDEIRAILADAARQVPVVDMPTQTTRFGLGTEIAALFSGTGYGFRPGEVEELRGGRWEIPDNET